MAISWSAYHLRLHQRLLREPLLLPPGAQLLLAVSGGQDSMALTALMLDLQRLHHWQLQLWHGNHCWRQESEQQAAALAAWAKSKNLKIQIDSWANPLHTEAAAREWRYSCLEQQAKTEGCQIVLTAHTANDRSETLLLHLARGSHRRGLGSLMAQRQLCPGIQLVRPLLNFSRIPQGFVKHWQSQSGWIPATQINVLAVIESVMRCYQCWSNCIQVPHKEWLQLQKDLALNKKTMENYLISPLKLCRQMIQKYNAKS